MQSDFAARGIHVAAVSQEDTDLAKSGQIASKISGDLWFDLLADLNRERSGKYDRTTSYLIDAKGIVRQVYPQMVRRRVDWHSVLADVDRLDIGKTAAP